MNYITRINNIGYYGKELDTDAKNGRSNIRFDRKG